MPESVYKFKITDPESNYCSEVLTLTERQTLQTLHSLISHMGDMGEKQWFFNNVPVSSTQTPHAIAAFPMSTSGAASSQSGYLERDVQDDIVNVITISARETETSPFAHKALRAIQKRQLALSESAAQRAKRSSRI